jgi:hypothetical protein
MPSTQESKEDFFELYFDYVGRTEAPRLFHRWCAITAVGALLGRQCWLPFGHWTLYPNMYMMLMGSPGARKGTAIMIAKRMMERQGYERFSADRTSPERFLYDLLQSNGYDSAEELLELNIDGIVCERTIATDEFTDFTGTGNMSFLTMLAKLWDCHPQYEHPKLHGKSIIVPNPTVSIMAGNTPQNFIVAFPAEAIGQGCMSRIILVHSDPIGVKITDPPEPTEASIAALKKYLIQVQLKAKGAFTIAPDAMEIRERMYRGFKDIEDYRFQHYSTRRFTHLQKIAMIFTALRHSTVITAEDCLKANTLLHYTEVRMPKALGEFGKSRNSDVANSVLEILKRIKQPVTTRYLWKQVAQDLNRQEELIEIINNLKAAGKVQVVSDAAGKQGYVPRFEDPMKWDKDLILENYLTEEEKT